MPPCLPSGENLPKNARISGSAPIVNIGIDGYNLAMPAGTGIATYGLTLARTLQGGGHAVTGVFGIDVGREEGLREVCFYDQVSRGEPAARTKAQARRDRRRLLLDALPPRRRLDALEVPRTGRVETETLADRLPRFDRLVSAARLFDIAHRHFTLHGRFVELRVRNPPAVMHWTYPVPVKLAGVPNIYTLHDLVPLKFPYTTLDNKKVYSALVGRCVRDGAHICTVSEASKRDILAEFNAPAERVTNCYQASPLPESFLSQPAAAHALEIDRIFGLGPQTYFLYFGAIEPKKNIGRLLEAYLGLDTPARLVMVGGRAWSSEGELKLMAFGGPGDGAGRVLRLDYLSRGLLLKLIRSARAVVFPSLYEGFGLPVLEAMQLGVPVLTSDRGALPEVAGDAAVPVDPYDVSAIAGAMVSLDEDAGLRARLGAAGLAQAAKFTQARFAKRLEAMYAHVLG